MTMRELLQDYVIALPEDVQKAKDYGDYDRALRLIERHLSFTSNQTLHNRLRIEKEVLRRLPFEYPYTEAEGLALIQKEIPNFTMEELRSWQDVGGADWIYRNGEVYLQDRFYASMKKVYPEIQKRAKQPQNNTSLLDEIIQEIKQKGELRYRFHVRHSLKIKDAHFLKKEVLVHIPLPTNSRNVSHIQVIKSTDGAYIDDENSISRTISFRELPHTNHPYEVEYTFDTYMKYHDLFDGTQGIESYAYPELVKEEYPHIVFTPTIRKLCAELCDGCKNPLEKAWHIYQYCTEEVRYSFMRSYITIPNIPEYVSQQRIGDCGVMALLFITLCRCAGIPAQWQSGQYVTPYEIGNHDWATFYIEPFGWLYCDPSFGNSAYHEGNIERQHFYFGNLDPFRMVANNGFMCELNPPKTQWRNDPFDNQSGEIEYVHDRGLLAHEFEKERIVVSAEKLS